MHQFKPPLIGVVVDYGWDEEGYCSWCEMPADVCRCEHPTAKAEITEFARQVNDYYRYPFGKPTQTIHKPEKPGVYRNGTSCLAMKEVEPGVWMQCCKQELHRGFCDFSLGPDWQDKVSSTAESGEASAEPAPLGTKTETPKPEPSRTGQLIFGVHDRYGGLLPPERQDEKAMVQLTLLG